MKKILIIGATSAIAHQTAINFAKDGAELVLAARNLQKLESVKQDILTRYKTQIHLFEFDANNFDYHKDFISQVIIKMNGLTHVLIAHGTLPEQEKIKNDVDLILQEFKTNTLSVISLATIVSEYFEQQKSGALAVISSVAGDRARKSNYIYGTTKGAVSLFMQGLSGRFADSNVKIINIKPGFVDTPMTAHLQKGFLFAKANEVGKGIYNAMNNGQEVVYLPGFWRLIMFIVKHIPASIFKKLNF